MLIFDFKRLEFIMKRKKSIMIRKKGYFFVERSEFIYQLSSIWFFALKLQLNKTFHIIRYLPQSLSTSVLNPTEKKKSLFLVYKYYIRILKQVSSINNFSADFPCCFKSSLFCLGCKMVWDLSIQDIWFVWHNSDDILAIKNRQKYSLIKWSGKIRAGNLSFSAKQSN